MHHNIIVASLMLLLAVLASFHCLIYQYQCPNGHKVTQKVLDSKGRKTVSIQHPCRIITS